MLTIHGRSFKNGIISITKPQFVSPYLKGIKNYLNSLHKRCHLILVCAKLGNIMLASSKVKAKAARKIFPWNQRCLYQNDLPATGPTLETYVSYAALHGNI